MDTTVFLAMLVAAFFHAGWNALLKLKVEPLVAVVLVSAGSSLVTLPLLPLLPFVGVPATGSWPFLAASLLIHLVYFLALAEAYRHGDLGQAYPIARGSAPLMTALGALAVTGEAVGPLAWAGILVLAGGILLLSVAGGRTPGGINRHTAGFSLLTAASIAAYTLVDGLGARWSGSPVAYVVWLMFLIGVMMVTVGLVMRGAAIGRAFRQSWPLAIAGGAMSVASYGIAVWAMTVAPITIVAALRETSVLFAVLIGVLWLGEPVRPARVAAVALAFLGVALLRVG